MKKALILGAVICSVTAIAQTNRIHHYSHSGKNYTLNIFKSNDNMGLGCGSVYNKEITPSLDTNTVYILDSAALKDTNRVCTPKQPNTRMKSITPKVDTTRVYNRGPR